MTFDPYIELDLPRGDLDPETVKRAHRKRVKKTHPDAGGNPEAFIRTGRALAVLTDPKRKAHYDTTGRIEDEPVDNDRATALQMIEAFFSNVVNEHLSGKSILYRDVVRECREHMLKENRTSADGRENGIKFVAEMRAVLGRFSEASVPFRRSIENRIAVAEQQIATLLESERCREVALAILNTCDYHYDQSPAARWSRNDWTIRDPRYPLPIHPGGG